MIDRQLHTVGPQLISAAYHKIGLRYVYIFHSLAYLFMELFHQVSRWSPDWEDLELHSDRGSPTHDSHMGSPGFDNDNADIEIGPGTPKPSAEVSKPLASTMKGQKRKTISEMVQDESEHIRVSRIKIAEV